MATTVLTAVLATATPALAVTGALSRVSVSSEGVQSDATTFGGLGISADGRYVAFASDGATLVPGDTNGATDVFVRDRSTGTTTRVSVADDGAQADSTSANPVLSADGRYVAFESFADNLVPGDTNDTTDVFVRDRVAGTTSRVNVSTDGAQANGFSGSPFRTLAISADGRYVAFASIASNLVPGDTNDSWDVFVRDRFAATTRRVSVSTTGAQADAGSFNVAISASGRYVAFDSEATNLVPRDTNGVSDVFVRDRDAGVTTRVSVAGAGTQGNAASSDEVAISADGREVAFGSDASNLVAGDTNGVRDVFVRDRWNRVTRRVSVSTTGAQGNGPSFLPSISGDGRFVAFGSVATNLVPVDANGGTTDVFVRDRSARTTTLVSVADDGTPGNGISNNPVISAGGGDVAFISVATNLVPDDTNNAQDAFVWSRIGS